MKERRRGGGGRGKGREVKWVNETEAVEVLTDSPSMISVTLDLKYSEKLRLTLLSTRPRHPL